MLASYYGIEPEKPEDGGTIDEAGFNADNYVKVGSKRYIILYLKVQTFDEILRYFIRLSSPNLS